MKQFGWAGEASRGKFLKFAMLYLMISHANSYFSLFEVGLTENGLLDSILRLRRRAMARWMVREHAEIIGGVRS